MQMNLDAIAKLAFLNSIIFLHWEDAKAESREFWGEDADGWALDDDNFDCITVRYEIGERLGWDFWDFYKEVAKQAMARA